MSELIDLYNGVLKYNGNEIIVVIDDDNILWFFGKQIAKILDYKDPRRAINDIDSFYKTKKCLTNH